MENRFLPCGDQCRGTIALAYMDYAKKKTGVGKIVYPTGDYEKDMAEIMAFYAQIHAKFPEQFSVDTRYYPET